MFLRFVFLLLALSFAPPFPVLAQEAGETEPAGEETEASTPDELQILIDALRDEESRNRLIEELETAVGEAEQGPAEVVDEALLGSEGLSLGRRIAETTSYFAENALQSVTTFWQQILAAPNLFSALDADQTNVLWDALRELALTIVATYAIFLVLRYVALGFYRSMGARARNGSILQRAVLIVASAVVDALVVVLAWAAGYLVVLVFGEFGEMGLRQTLYLNAFLIVELAKVVLRIVLSPSTGALRLVAVSERAAIYMNRGFTWTIGILGYGQLLVLPIFKENLSLAAGSAVTALIALIAVLIAVVMTLSHRREVAAWLLDTPEHRPRNRQLEFLARRWHWPVLLYLACLFVLVLAGSADVLMDVLAASAKILAAVIVGFGLAGWIARATARGVSLPEGINDRLPLLQGRLNAFVPKFLTVVRILVFIAVFIFILDVIDFIDVHSWLRTQVGIAATAAIVSVVLIVLGAFAAWLALNSWVDYRLNPDAGRPATVREQTLLSLLRNAATVAILVFALMFALSEIGINIAPLIASAGVLGLAIGFGAQKMVQDIITGIFIQLENSMDVGDVVSLGATIGTVERLTVRSVSLRDLDGSYHVIPFSSVDVVTNYMRDFGYHVGDIRVGYRENVEDARAAIVAAFEELRGDPEMTSAILDDLEWFGVQSLNENAVLLRVRIKTVPGKQWGVGRAFNAIVKRIFDERGIEIPFPGQTIYFGADRQGRAPAAHILIEQKAADAREEGAETSMESAPEDGGAVRNNPDGVPRTDDGER